MSKEGARIALAGQDVNKSQPKDRVLDTELISLPIHLATAFSGVLDVNNRDYTISIPHKLGFRPLFRAWSQLINTDADPSNYVSVPQLKPIDCRTGGANGTGSGVGAKWDITGKSYIDRVDIRYAFADAGVGPFPPNKFSVGGYIFIFETRWENLPNA